jgi:addiction module RelE/StbE family toxin
VRVIWTRAALNDTDRAYDYLADFNPKAAVRVATALRADGDGLKHFPHRGRPVPGTNMRELVTSHSYLVRYRISGDTVLILRVRHTSRRPTKP